MSNITRAVRNKYSAGAASLGLLSSQAMAAVPTEVSTALDTAKTDVGTIALAVLLIFVAIFAFKVLKRAF